MSKPALFANNPGAQTSAPAGFNLINQETPFKAIFDTKPLDALEATRIEKLLIDNFQPGPTSEEQVKEDVERLKQITSEIKAVGRQGAILMGERVHAARELLKPYKDGTFTAWLEATFGARKTGYNLLAYHDLYKALPHDSQKDHLTKIPQRTAYILASRDGELNKKIEIINESPGRTHNELVALIQEKLPLSSNDKRAKKDPTQRYIALIRDAINKLSDCKNLTFEDLEEIRGLAADLKFLANV